MALLEVQQGSVRLSGRVLSLRGLMFVGWSCDGNHTGSTRSP